MTGIEQPLASRVILRTDRLGRVADGVAIVHDVSLEVFHGELLGIVGASGSGKSSLLRLLNRLDEPTSGTVYLDGIDYTTIAPRELRRRLGMVTQRPFLFPGTVASNLQFGPQQRGDVLPDETTDALLRQVGIDGFARTGCLQSLRRRTTTCLAGPRTGEPA